MKAPSLRIHHLLPFSRANGPGTRAVLWVQGCTLGCPGCFNPETHSFRGGEHVSVDDLFRRIAALEPSIEGLTISGGEPLQQRRAVLALLRRVRAETALSVLLFTGYTWEEVQGMAGAQAVLDCVDVLLAGRYEASRHRGRTLLGSDNKTVHFLSSRYVLEDLQSVPPAEIVIMADGSVVVSGIDPPRWRSDRGMRPGAGRLEG